MATTDHTHHRTLRGTNSSSSNVLPPRLRLIVHVAVQDVLSAVTGVVTRRFIGAMILYRLITVVHRLLGIMSATVEPPLARMPTLASSHRRLAANVSRLRETRVGIWARAIGFAAPAPEFSLSRQLAATHSAQPFLHQVDPEFLSPPFYCITGTTPHTFRST